MRGKFQTRINGVVVDVTSNLIVNSAFQIIRKTLRVSPDDYRLRHIYVEYENTAGTPETPVFDETRSVDYYLNLSGNSDYLRVPVTFSVDTGEEVQLLSRVVGQSGQRGLAFSAASDSQIIGYAVAASPAPDDPTQDVLFSANYLNQVVSVADEQINVEYILEI
jgi:hypothetical protein